MEFEVEERKGTNKRKKKGNEVMVGRRMKGKGTGRKEIWREWLVWEERKDKRGMKEIGMEGTWREMEKQETWKMKEDKKERKRREWVALPSSILTYHSSLYLFFTWHSSTLPNLTSRSSVLLCLILSFFLTFIHFTVPLITLSHFFTLDRQATANACQYGPFDKYLRMQGSVQSGPERDRGRD